MFRFKRNQPYERWKNAADPFGTTRLKVGIMLVAGVTIAVAIGVLIDGFMRQQLQHRSTSFALAVDPIAVEQLKNTAQRDDQVPYAAIKQKLAQLKAVYGDSEFVYIMSHTGGITRFLADSEPVQSDSYSPRNQIYNEATPELIRLFSTAQPIVEGPVSDSYGLWYSSLAPIRDANGKLVAVMGVDVPAKNYLFVTFGVAVGIILTTLSLCFVVYYYDRQRNRRFEAFRLQIQLMSIASHELRTPLSGIRWGQEVLLQGKMDDTQEIMVKAMYDSTLQLQESIEDILQLAALGSNKAKNIVRLPINITEVIDSVKTVQQLPAQQKEITFVYDDSWPGAVTVDGDATQLRRVFNNLASNAVKYASIGSPITFSYRQEANNHVIIIKNQGIGVPQKELAHIFDGFFRASNAIEKQVNGTGMGLYLSRQAVEQHGGRLWIESVENESTTAYVSLPITDAASSATPSSPVSPPQ